MIMQWRRVSEKTRPHKKPETVLVAWSCTSGNGEYDVLIHWPDGTWTDQCEEDVEETPDYWMPIIPPGMEESA